MALSFALSFAVLLSAVLPVQSSYCASTCAVHVTQPILFFVANAPNHIPGLSRKPMVDPHRSKLVYMLLVCDTCQQCLRRRYQSWTTQISMQHMQKSCPLDYSWSVLQYMRPSLASNNVSWQCCRCGMLNFSSSFFDSTISEHTIPLSILSPSSSSIADSRIGEPIAMSSPVADTRTSNPKRLQTH